METMWKRVLSFVLVLALLVPNFATIASATEGEDVPAVEVISEDILSEAEEETPEEEPEIIPEESEEVIPEESEEVIPEESEEVVPEESEEVIPEESEEVIPEESEEGIPEESEEVIPEESGEVIPEESEEVIPEESEEMILEGEITVEETMEVVDAVVEEEPEEEIILEGSVTGEVCTYDDGESADELLEAYIQAVLMDENTASYGVQGRNRLDVYRKYLYDQVAPMLQAVAQGKTEEYQTIDGKPGVVISQEDLADAGFTVTWTAEELGLETLVNDAGNAFSAEATAAVTEKVEELWQSENLLNALQTDYPLAMYWWGKGYAPNAGFAGTASSVTITSVELYLTAAAQYSVKDANGNATGVLDPSTIADLQTTLATVKTNAKNIVESYSDRESYTDFNRLSNYKKEICDLTGYDFDAPGTFGTDSNPWQLLWVFDGDPATEVVCEGYSKAFQYLYDLTFEKGYFDGDVYSYLVTGDMNGDGHMWNVVDLYGKSYLVDVTNSDTGMIGQDGELFMVGGNGSVEDGYTYTFHAGTENETHILYEYDGDIKDTYGSALRLSTSNPGQAKLEAALTHCVYLTETSGEPWYWVLENDVTITDDMTVNAILHVGDGPNDQVKVDPVTLTVAEGATLTVPAGIEFENNDTIVIEAGGSITGTGTYSGNEIEVREGGSLTLTYANAETEVKTGRLGFMWLEWNEESQQLYVPAGRQPDYNMISAPEQIHAGVFCYYDAAENLVYVPYSDLVSGNEGVIRLEEAPGGNAEEAIDGKITRVFSEGNLGESSVISHTAEDGTVYQLLIRLQMHEDGFYTEAKRDEDCYITGYQMHPLREENAFYFNFSREDWYIDGEVELTVSCGDEWQNHATITQVANSDIYKITLSDELVNSNAFGDGFSVSLMYDITNGTDWERDRESGIWCFFTDLWNGWDTAFRINGLGMAYFPQYDGFMGPDEENGGRLVKRTLPDGVTYDYSTRTLHLNNASLTNLAASGGEIPVLNLHLTGDNFITAEGDNYAIGLHDGAQLNILGDGSLTVRAPESESAPDPIIEIGKRSSLTIGDNANVTLEGRDEDVLGWHLCGISGDGTGSLIMEGGTLTTVNGDNAESGNYCGICTGVGYITLRGGTLNVNRLERTWDNVANSLTMEGGTLNAGHVILRQAMELRSGELNTGLLEHYSYLAIGGGQENQTMTVNVSRDDGPAVDSYSLLHLMPGANATFTNTNPNDENDVGLFTRLGVIVNGGTLNASGSTGIYFETDQGAQFEMSGGTVNASGLWGFHVKGGRVNLMRGTLNATGTGDANQNQDGILHVFGMLLDEGAAMIVNGGNGHTFTAVDNDDNTTTEGVFDALSKALGVQNGGSLVMNGGAINLDGEMALYNVTEADEAAISGSYAITDENGNALQLQMQELGGANLFSIKGDGPDGYASNAKLTAAWADAGITWNVENGVLTISGNGKLADFAVNEEYIPETPWHVDADINSITSVVVEEGITRIGNNAFTAMPNVQTISLPASLQELVPGFAFRNPASFTIAAGGRYYVHDDVIIVSGTETEPARVLRASNSFTGTFTPPTGVTAIGDSSFEGIVGLTSIDLTGITEIGYGAFVGSGLTTVTIPEGITVIHSGAFNGLTLDSLTLPVSLEAVESNAFDTIKINQLHYSGSASQWANVNIAAYNAALQAAIPTMTFGVTEENERDNTDPYLSIFHLENHGNGWFEPEEKYFEEELGMCVGDTYYGMVYLNTWTGTETAGGWLRTPLKASELRVTNLEDYAGLELLSLQEAHEHIANNEANGDYFLRLSINGNWNSRGAITYSYGEKTLQIPVGVHRAGFGYYDDSIVYGNDGNIAVNLEDEGLKNNAWMDYYDSYDPFAEVGATFYALVDYDWVATGLPYIPNEEFQGQTWAKVSYWNGTEFKPADSWTEGTTAKLFKIELTPGAPANPFRVDMELPVARVENGELIDNGDVWGRGIDVGVATGGEENPWYACFDINDVHYDVFEKGYQAHQNDNSWTLEELPYGISYDPDTNTITLENVNAQDVHSLRAQYRWHDEGSGDSGTNFPNENLTIKLVGNNTMYGNLDTVLAFSDDLNVTITSDVGGTLSVEAFNKPDNFNEHGDPYAFNTVSVERGASLTIAGNASVTAEIGGQGYWDRGNPAHASAIWMNGNNLTVKDNASLTTVVPDGARQVNGWWENDEFVGGYGEINDFGQLLVDDNATVNTGRIDIPEIWKYDEESGQDYFTGYGGNLIINGGTVNVTPSSNYNVWEENGETRTEYWFAGIHNNRGTIQVNGGTLNINAPAYVADQNNSFNAINMDGGSMTVNGGKVIVNGTELNDGGWQQNGDIANACGLRLGYGDNDNRTYPASVTVNDGFLLLGSNGDGSRSIGHDAHSGTFTVNGGTIVAHGDAHFNGKLKQTGGELEFYSGEVSFNNMVQAQGGVMHLNSWQIRLNDTAKFTISGDAEVYTHAWNEDSEGWYEHFTIEPYASMEVKGGKLEINFSNFDVGFYVKGEYLQTDGQVSVLSNTAPKDHVDSNVEVAFVATGLVELQGGELNANAEVGYVQDYEFGAPEYDVAENPNGRLEVSGGTLNATGTISGMEIYAPVELTGGSVKAEATTDNDGAAVVVWDNRGKASLTITGGEHTFTAPVEGSNDAYMSKGLLVDDAPVVVEAADGETVTVEIQAECTVAELTWDTTQSRMSGNKLIFTSLMNDANEIRDFQYRDVTKELGIEDDVTVYMQYLDENQGSGDIVYNTHVRIGDEPLVIKPNEAAIGQKQYPTLEEAIKAANDDDFINIIAPVAEKPNVTINKALTILNFYNYPLWEEDAAAALNQIVDTNYSVTVNSVIYYINPAPAGQTNVAQIGTTKYTTVKAALEAAQSGQTVTMIADSDESGKDLIVNAGVTLYLGAHDLKVRSLIGAEGGFVYGNIYAPNGDHGRLKAETLRLGAEAPKNDAGNNIIPIFDPDQDWYVFSLYIIKPDTYTGIEINEEEEEIFVRFFQNLSGTVRKNILTENETIGKYDMEANKYKVILQLSWQNDNGTYEQEYIYKNEFVQSAAKNTKTYFTYTLKGYTSLGLTAEVMDTLRITPVIVTDSGVISAGETYEASDSEDGLKDKANN